jgi:hypothetical protein
MEVLSNEMEYRENYLGTLKLRFMYAIRNKSLKFTRAKKVENCETTNDIKVRKFNN